MLVLDWLGIGSFGCIDIVGGLEYSLTVILRLNTNQSRLIPCLLLPLNSLDFNVINNLANNPTSH